MHLPTASRPARAGRLSAATALAVVVLLAPTAGADVPPGATAQSGARTGHDVGHHRADPAAAPVVVPVGSTADPTAETGDEDRDEERADQRDDERADEREDQREDQREDEREDERDGDEPPTTAEPDEDTASAEPAPTAAAVPAGGRDGDDNGLDVLGRDCSDSDLPPHDGFQESPACVGTQMGEVAAEDELPSLLITAAPETVEVDESFRLEVSTRNLVRDRFLGAADGGYYLESSFLDDDGLQRGHFHTACRLLPSTSEAPDSGEAPEFFLATQDNRGGAEPDTVTVDVPGIDAAGELQCTSWAGDGSHRTPMMTRADQTPAIDSVRITVRD
jgi:hypothetical protein